VTRSLPFPLFKPLLPIPFPFSTRNPKPPPHHPTPPPHPLPPSSYQLWDTAQAVCSSAVRVITTEALLKSLGVGDSA
jgi:hypothetical protein